MAADGFSKADVKTYIFENARMPVGMLRDRGYWASRTWPAWVNAHDDRYMVPPVSRPENVIIVVAGGDGRHSAWLPTWSTSRGGDGAGRSQGIAAGPLWPPSVKIDSFVERPVRDGPWSARVSGREAPRAVGC